ncbi:MAG: hypothetical protein KBG83_00045 [Bacteroidetes bacterium]|nr:hypothetical protein [Bacteroidota bacterium]
MKQKKINDIAQPHETIKIESEQILDEKQEEEQTGVSRKPKYKFTFEFEVYERNILVKKQDISVLEEDEDRALEEAVHMLGLALDEYQSIRYTGKFRKENE